MAEQIFYNKIKQETSICLGHKDALYRNDKTIRFIFFTALHVTPFMGKVHIHFDMTYTKMISDYQSWFIIATLYFFQKERAKSLNACKVSQGLHNLSSYLIF